MKFYKNRILELEKQLDILQKKWSLFSGLRFLSALILIYSIFNFYTAGSSLFLIISLITFGLFVYFVVIHRKLSAGKKMTENIIAINREELDFVTNGKKSGRNGSEFIQSEHTYSFDLDIFGENSFFHFLNRTATAPGHDRLAETLSKSKNTETILPRQDAIKELSEKIKWRQEFTAQGRWLEDSKSDYNSLLDWIEKTNSGINKTENILSFILPLFFLVTLTIAVLGEIKYGWPVLGFITNLIFFATQAKKIKAEMLDARNISQIISHYGLMLEKTEQTVFSSELLTRLRNKALGAGEKLKKLSKIFLQLEGINFGLGAIFTNGTIALHTHAFRSLLKWKSDNKDSLKTWLDIIAEIDALNSLANFTFNQPDFAFPEINSDLKVEFLDLGHPMIPDEVRVGNDIQLNISNFIILTGSNMSGKSTFLRSLGINMLLTQIGAPVCAKKASVHPLPLLVSMRQTDSLVSGESYFFAEVKRLKMIMDTLAEKPAFVLLDEILRGTNSDDKQAGTIGVIKKLTTQTVLGAIATHDLEVCKLTNEYPDKLSNKNFEVEIIDDELHFDYKLREGVCKNKSATFLIKKMGIAD